jgi:hypothetical protein
MPDHPLPPDHAARQRPTPYPSPRKGQVWRDRDGHHWTVERVWRRDSRAAGTVELSWGGQRLKTRGAVILTEWTLVEDDR